MGEALRDMRIRIGNFPWNPSQTSLSLTFSDRKGNRHEHHPKWIEIVALIEAAATVEHINQRPDRWLAEWAELTQRVAREAGAAIRSAHKVEGDFEIKGGRFVFHHRRQDWDGDIPAGHWLSGGQTTLTPGFVPTETWARLRAGEYCQGTVVNDVVVDVQPVEPPRWCYDHADFNKPEWAL